MSDVVHHAIIITSFNQGLLADAHERACEIFPFVSDILPSIVNNYDSFFIPPDGSKEFWTDSEKGNERRALFINWINEQSYEDGSNCLEFIEVAYGSSIPYQEEDV